MDASTARDDRADDGSKVDLSLLPVLVLLLAGLDLLRMKIRHPERWRLFTSRSGEVAPFPRMSRFNVWIAAMWGLFTIWSVTSLIAGIVQLAGKTEQNTREMGEVITKMRESTDQSLNVLAAMREEADAARRETAAAQKLALWVGVGTAIIGAILGGVAGAFAAEALS